MKQQVLYLLIISLLGCRMLDVNERLVIRNRNFKKKDNSIDKTGIPLSYVRAYKLIGRSCYFVLVSDSVSSRLYVGDSLKRLIFRKKVINGAECFSIDAPAITEELELIHEKNKKIFLVDRNKQLSTNTYITILRPFTAFDVMYSRCFYELTEQGYFKLKHIISLLDLQRHKKGDAKPVEKFRRLYLYK